MSYDYDYGGLMGLIAHGTDNAPAGDLAPLFRLREPGLGISLKTEAVTVVTRRRAYDEHAQTFDPDRRG